MVNCLINSYFASILYSEKAISSLEQAGMAAAFFKRQENIPDAFYSYTYSNNTAEYQIQKLQGAD